jgi:hypothetical protein
MVRVKWGMMIAAEHSFVMARLTRAIQGNQRGL